MNATGAAMSAAEEVAGISAEKNSWVQYFQVEHTVTLPGAEGQSVEVLSRELPCEESGRAVLKVIQAKFPGARLMRCGWDFDSFDDPNRQDFINWLNSGSHFASPAMIRSGPRVEDSAVLGFVAETTRRML